MIRIEELQGLYYVNTDASVTRFGPFESLRAKGQWYGSEDNQLDLSTMETWKDVVGIRKEQRYFFEKQGEMLEYKKDS